MHFCLQCNSQVFETAKFCDNCGQQLRPANTAPQQRPVTEEQQVESYGKGADAILAFFGGRYFKALMVVLAVIGIAIALFTGGLRTSGVPSPEESYMMRDGWSPAPKYKAQPTRARSPDNSSASQRFRAQQKQ
ncbi:hypothetical protein ACFL17_08490 [Pseudomonadota bacterium]